MYNITVSALIYRIVFGRNMFLLSLYVTYSMKKKQLLTVRPENKFESTSIERTSILGHSY